MKKSLDTESLLKGLVKRSCRDPAEVPRIPPRWNRVFAVFWRDLLQRSNATISNSHTPDGPRLKCFKIIFGPRHSGHSFWQRIFSALQKSLLLQKSPRRHCCILCATQCYTVLHSKRTLRTLHFMPSRWRLHSISLLSSPLSLMAEELLLSKWHNEVQQRQKIGGQKSTDTNRTATVVRQESNSSQRVHIRMEQNIFVAEQMPTGDTNMCAGVCVCV